MAREVGGKAVTCLGTEGKKESCMVEDSKRVGEGLDVGEGKFCAAGVVENIGGKGEVGWK